jgi:hypothetical protein
MTGIKKKWETMKIIDDQAKVALDQGKTLIFSCPPRDRYVGANYRAYRDALRGYLFDVQYANDAKWRNPRGSHTFNEFFHLLPGPAQRTEAWQISATPSEGQQ